MKRAVPEPAYNPNDYVLRSAITGSYNVKVDHIISQIIVRYTSSAGIPGQEVSSTFFTALNINTLTNADIYVRNGNNLYNYESVIDDNTIFISPCNTVTDISDYGACVVETIDLRNATALVNFAVTANNLRTLYANGSTVDLENICNNLIGNSSVSDGVLWINRADTYASSIIATAISKGWTVYDL